MNVRAATLAAFLIAGSFEIALADGVETQVTNQLNIYTNEPSLDDTGTTVYAGSNANVSGTNPGFAPELFQWTASGGVGSLLAAIPGGARTFRDAISDDGAWIAFISSGNPTGGNADGST